MGIPNRDEIKGKAKQAAGEAKEKVADWTDDEKLESEAKKENELEEAEGEVQQKSGGQKRQAGEAVEDVREKIRRNQPRY